MITSSKETTFANIVIFAGQSNATDQGASSALTAAQQGVMTWARSFKKTADDTANSGRWYNYATGVNSMATQATAGKFGSACTMADRLFYTHGKVAFSINTAIGNTRLSNLAGAPNWSSAITTSYYNRCINTLVLPSINLLPTPNYKIAAYFWSQGESDAAVLAQANEYQANLIAFIAKVRLDLSLPNLPFIISRLKTTLNPTSYPYASTVIAAQDYVIANIANTYILNNETETYLADLVHYTDASYISIGNRLADLINPFCE